MTKTKLYVIAAVLVGLVALLLFYPSAPAAPQSIDCGSDMMCFMDAGQNCTLAKVATNQSGNSGIMEILGGDNSTCSLKLSITSVNTRVPEMAAYTDEIRASAAEWQGKDMTCAFPTGKVEQPDTAGTLNACTGALKDAVNKTTTLINAYAAELAEVSLACVPQQVWEFKETAYTVNGLEATSEGKACRVTYSFKAPNTGVFTVTQLFNRTAEKLEIDYSPGEARTGKNMADWCTGTGWEYRGSLGAATASDAQLVKGTEDFCSIRFTLLPATTELPGIQAEVVLDSGTETAIRIQTTAGSTAERVYKNA